MTEYASLTRWHSIVFNFWFDLFPVADHGSSPPATGATCYVPLEYNLLFAPKTLPSPAGLVTLHRMNMHVDTILITDQGTAPRCRLGVGIWCKRRTMSKGGCRVCRIHYTGVGIKVREANQSTSISLPHVQTGTKLDGDGTGAHTLAKLFSIPRLLLSQNFCHSIFFCLSFFSAVLCHLEGKSAPWPFTQALFVVLHHVLFILSQKA